MGLDMQAVFRSEKKVYCADALEGLSQAVTHCGRRQGSRDVRKATSHVDLRSYNRAVKILQKCHEALFDQKSVHDKASFKAAFLDKTDSKNPIYALHSCTYKAMQETRKVSKDEMNRIGVAFKNSSYKTLANDVPVLVHFSKVYLTLLQEKLDQENKKKTQANGIFASARDRCSIA